MNSENEISKLNFKKCLELEDEEKIYQFLFDRVFELGKVIIETKGIKRDEETSFIKQDKDSKLYRISEDIYYNSIWFESFRHLSNRVIYWNTVDTDGNPEETIEEKVENIVKIYNELMVDLEEYKRQKERIEKEGFKKFENELKEDLRDIFCKMLDYKSRQYKKDATLLELIEELILCYSDYKWLFDDTYTMLKSRMIYRNTMRDDFWSIRADDVEYISNLEFAYKYFAEDENSYKNYQQFYEDITLKEGQTLKDLCDEEREKMRQLFIEMLEFINVEIENKESFTSLELLVKKHYPFYYSNFITMFGTCNYSYIDTIHVWKSNYDYFKRTYKNHKEMLKRYVKDEEEWHEKAKYDDEICFDPNELNDLEKTKEQFSNYFENE